MKYSYIDGQIQSDLTKSMKCKNHWMTKYFHVFSKFEISYRSNVNEKKIDIFISFKIFCLNE